MVVIELNVVVCVSLQLFPLWRSINVILHFYKFSSIWKDQCRYSSSFCFHYLCIVSHSNVEDQSLIDKIHSLTINIYKIYFVQMYNILLNLQENTGFPLPLFLYVCIAYIQGVSKGSLQNFCWDKARHKDSELHRNPRPQTSS